MARYGRRKSVILEWRKLSENVRYWWSPPQLRHDGHFHGHWIELVLDLILVAFLSNLTHETVAHMADTNDVLRYFTIGLVFAEMFRMMHSITFVINALVVQDFVLLVLLGVGVCGCFVFSRHVKHNVRWHNQDHVGGMVLARVSLIALRGQLLLFRRSFHFRENCWSILLTFVEIILIQQRDNLPGASDMWIVLIMFMSNSVASFGGFHAVGLVSNWTHVNARLGMAVTICLGESIITIVKKAQNIWRSCVMYGIMCFCIALLYYNSRPHGFGDHEHEDDDSDGAEDDQDDADERPFQSRMRGSGTIVLHDLLAFSIFVVGLTLEAEVHFNKGHQGTQPLCDFWNARTAMQLISAALSVSQLLILIIRHAWKMDVTGRDIPVGRKFFWRAMLALMHNTVPVIIQYFPGLSKWIAWLFGFYPWNSFAVMHVLHLLVILSQTGLEFSLYKTLIGRLFDGESGARRVPIREGGVSSESPIAGRGILPTFWTSRLSQLAAVQPEPEPSPLERPTVAASRS
eukprot:TRINITY_DN15879_c0_g2_i2.p1 TRINITY_DN15879_c0_g2~~TRINITY_DN15879_c0_g2_i2.p1  ORF type:complete len:582 (-),score=66.49 TRINITY_DN15879_c0_g2_i2:44-1591(-)